LLEQRVAERTREISDKTRQLEAASNVARKIAEIRDLQALLNNVALSVADQFDYYHVGIFLLDDREQFAILQAASSEGGRKMLELGHRLAIGQTGIVGYVTGRGIPRVALDTGADAVFFDNPHLPLTHSEMALPLIVRGKVIGALDIQSNKIDAFSGGDIDVMQTVADQLSIAIENTRLFTESEAVISQFETLTTLQTRDAWANYMKRHAPAYQYSAFGVRPVRDVKTGEGPRSVRVPIELRGQEIGVIHLRRKENSPAWSNREREMALEIANQVALALDTSRLLEETQKSAARDQMVANVSNKIRETLDMETVLQTAADELRNAFGLMEAEVRLSPPPTPDRASNEAKGTQETSAGSNGKGTTLS
jgi:GAF domain-containing protein